MSVPVPGQPHPDVAIVKSVLSEVEPGSVIPYSKVAEAINYDPKSKEFYARCLTARKHLEREGVVFAAVPGEGFLRELPVQTKARVEGRETVSLRKKATRNITQLLSVDPRELPDGEQSELFAQLTINSVVKKVTGNAAKQKLIASSASASAEISVQKALDELKKIQ